MILDKPQILTSVLVGVLVVAAAAYRLLWIAPSSSASIGLRNFPQSPKKLLQWIFTRRRNIPNDESPRDQTSSK